MIDVSQWRANIGLWNYCQGTSSKPANGRPVGHQSKSDRSSTKTKQKPSLVLSFMVLLIFVSILCSGYLKFDYKPHLKGVFTHCYWSKVQCTNTDSSYLLQSILPGSDVSSSDVFYSLVYLINLLLLSGDVELNPGPLTVKGLNMAAVLQIFESSAHEYMLIGVGLKVKVSDLMPTPGAEQKNLNTVFQRWFDSNKNVSWETLMNLCDDFPDQLGKAKDNLQAYVVKKPTMSAVLQIFDSFANHYRLIGVGLKVKVTDLMPIPGTAQKNLNTVFQRWFDSDKNVSWETLMNLCDEFPDQLGKAKDNVQAYVGYANTYSKTLPPASVDSSKQELKTMAEEIKKPKAQTSDRNEQIKEAAQEDAMTHDIRKHKMFIQHSLQDIVKEWKTLGDLLGIEKRDLDQIECEHGAANLCRINMITRWLQKDSANLESLIEALEVLGQNRIIATLKKPENWH
ncbi:PREDICTED: uncharacterized protein LOC109585609 [Amphimedon queenslandica]|uniref:Death domain-containing protein n=1 Tax=Amphimedon queenslandica TaxID=400682 RepID=A0A1X7TXB4_AMPQE|nr:PREDICTED: uncharacterized protein LOC109585609 [Amphimedon queenslandica]|eukprot:XP_019857297.1 PREDICTED: uncharacterized protein LOC109585609 [Amphimedon queenslandica]